MFDPGLEGTHEASREKKSPSLSREATKMPGFPALMSHFPALSGS